MIAREHTGNKYVKIIHPRSQEDNEQPIHVDVYSVINAWEVKNAGLQQALKKILMPGCRGEKSFEQDCYEAIDAISRAIQLDADHRHQVVANALEMDTRLIERHEKRIVQPFDTPAAKPKPADAYEVVPNDLFRGPDSTIERVPDDGIRLMQIQLTDREGWDRYAWVPKGTKTIIHDGQTFLQQGDTTINYKFGWTITVPQFVCQ